MLWFLLGLVASRAGQADIAPGNVVGLARWGGVRPWPTTWHEGPMAKCGAAVRCRCSVPIKGRTDEVSRMPGL